MKRFRTVDSAGAIIHTVEQIGPKQALTPEGFLLCSDVPLARTGTMLYGAGQTPITPGRDHLARVTRDAADLFDPATIASFNGKPVVNDHPPEGEVHPDNFKNHTVGVTLNPRRGTGSDADILVGDLLITDKFAIRAVRAGKREVSAGYTAHYIQTGDGEGKQSGIIGNHIALVERGRCGPRCAIGDHDSTTTSDKERFKMPQANSAPRKRHPLPEVLASLREAGIIDEEDEETGKPGDVHVHVHGQQQTNDSSKTNDGELAGRVTALEGGISEIKDMLKALTPKAAPTADEAAAQRTADAAAALAAQQADRTDSAALETGFKEVMADAEILVPGFQFPTFDAKALRTVTIDSMCATRKKVLSTLAATTEGAAFVNKVAGEGFDLSKADCATAAVVFKAAAALKKGENNTRSTNDSRSTPANTSNGQGGLKVMSIAEINAANTKFWEAQVAASKSA